MRYAQAVARTGSFSAAAREYDVTQPALSNAIRRLEESLGARLFERSTHGTRPTVFGATILPRIEDALAALDAVIAEARSWREAEARRPVRIGVSPLISADVVARAHRAVVGLPGRGQDCLVLREADLSELCSALDDDELDLIVVPAVLELTRYRHHVIGREPVVLVEPGTGGAADSQVPVGEQAPVAPASPTQAGDDSTASTPMRAVSARIGDVAARTLLLVPDTCGLTTFTRDLLADRGLPLRAYSGEAASYRVLEDWAGMGLGSALLPRSKVTRADSRVLPVVDADGAAVTITYEAAWDGTSPIASELEALAGLLAV
nr:MULTISPECIES: LysR family transcriptional regulator [unclassified Actinomyces]